MGLYVVYNYTQASPHSCWVSVKDPWVAAKAVLPGQEHSRRHGSGITLSHAGPGDQDTPARGMESPLMPSGAA